MSELHAVQSELRDIAAAVARLSPDWQRPERFFERRDELRQRLNSIASKVEKIA